MKVNVISESAFTVQGHGVHTAFTETVDELRDYTDCEVLVNSNQPADILHIHTVGPYSLSKIWFAKGAKVVSAHVTPDSFVGSLAGARYWRPLAHIYLRWFYNRADAVLGVSQETVEELRAMGVKKPLYLVPNTIRGEVFRTTPEKRLAARKTLGIPEDDFVVIGNGQVQPRKRIDCFVDAAKELPKVRFIWVGGMPFKKLAANSTAMQNLMENHSANLNFTGLLDRSEVVKYYQAADLFFLPSAQETFGIVIVEAAAAGLPVLLRNLQQYQVTFGDGYERGVDDKFTSIIRRFESDHEYYQIWKKKSRTIAEKYDAKEGAAQLMDIYRDVIDKMPLKYKNGARV